MPDGTTYKKSYEAMDPQKMKHCRGVPIKHSSNLASAGDMSMNTTNGVNKYNTVYSCINYNSCLVKVDLRQ